MSGEAMLAAINAQIDATALDGRLAFSPDAWATFKTVVPRREYRKRKGTRFVNQYRGVPIAIHDEWSWGWQLIPLSPSPLWSKDQ